MSATPDVSVVIPTRNRAGRLARQLATLRRQSIGAGRFEVIVVDDGSVDGTPSLLWAERARGELDLRLIRHDRSRGPAAARNDGWRAARGALIAFTDDDCETSPDWLVRGIEAWSGEPQRFVQGATAPIAGERDRLRRFAYSIEVDGLTPEFQTCNIFYPRALLERIGGFDAEAFAGPQGEDADLGWRAQAAGARPVFASDARVEHAVMEVGAFGMLRRAWRWSLAMLPFARHHELRRTRLHHGLFWNWSHYLLARAVLGAGLARRRWAWPLAWWLARPLAAYELERAQRDGQPALAAYWLVHDVVETAGVLRGAVRYRVLVI